MVLTSEQARDLVECFGSQRKAAKAVGVARTTLVYWLHPERQRQRSRRRYSDPEYRERKCESMRERRERLMNEDRCTNCGSPRLSDWYCWDCLDKKAGTW